MWYIRITRTIIISIKSLLDFDVLLILKETFCNIWLSLSRLKLIFFDNIFTGCEPSEWIVGLFIKGVFTCLNWLFSLFEEVKKSSGKNPFFILVGVIGLFEIGLILSFYIYYLFFCFTFGFLNLMSYLV